MQTVSRSYRVKSALLMPVVALTMFGSVVAPQVALSQTSASAPVQKKKSFVQKHRHLTSLGAGYVAYKAAKITGKNRAAHGGKKNFAQRHPFLTGAGAALATNHVLKKHQQKTGQ